MDKTSIPILGLRTLARVWLRWMATALLLLPVAAALVWRAENGSAGMGYYSSALSFLCALSACAFLVAGKLPERFLTGLLCGVALLIPLLSLSFLIGGKAPDSSSVLSVSSFTLSGCLAGCVFLSGKNRRKGKRRSLPGNRSRRFP